MKNPIIDKYGAKRWLNEKRELHREDGPAYITKFDDKWWFIHNKIHRLDGPACERANGEKYWYFDDQWLKHITSQEEFEQYLKLKAFI